MNKPEEKSNEANVRFFDNRQKYLMFVNSCTEKLEISKRLSKELNNFNPTPPSVRIFDAGIGDGTVLAGLMRAMHFKYPTMPFYVVAKEVSLEDVRIALNEMPDRLFEHPSTVLVLTNLYYAESPWLKTNSSVAANQFVWKDVALKGSSAHEFQSQINELSGFLSENWRTKIGKAGNPVYERPVVLVLYREDHRFLLDPIIPRPGTAHADFDLIVAAQPYRARASAKFKAEKIIGPLSRALKRGGRLVGIHSSGNDPALEIVQKIWPKENPFQVDRHDILKAVKAYMGSDASEYTLNAGSDKNAIFKYQLHHLADGLSSNIGTSSVMAGWNAATYVSQIEEQRVEDAMLSNDYIEATRSVLNKYDGLWFNNESYTITRKGP